MSAENYNSQMGMDFFYGLDGETFGAFVEGPGPPSQSGAINPEVARAEGPVGGVAGAFYASSLSDFETLAKGQSKPMAIISNLIDTLVTKNLIDYDVNLRSAWADFGQGTLFDQRRNVEVGEYKTLDGRTVEKHYGFWPVHAMDGWYEKEAEELGLSRPNPPGEYYTFYGAVRAFYVLADSEAEKTNWLNFARSIAIGSAVQNQAKPMRIVNPASFPDGAGSQLETPYPDPTINKPLDPGLVQNIIDHYWPMTVEQLDNAFKNGDPRLGGTRPKTHTKKRSFARRIIRGQ